MFVRCGEPWPLSASWTSPVAGLGFANTILERDIMTKLLFAALAIAGGIAVATQAAANAGLRAQIGRASCRERV